MRVNSVDPGTFSYDPDQPTYYTELLSWNILNEMQRMYTQNMQWVADNSDDRNSLAAELKDDIADIISWWDSAIAAKLAGNPIPAKPTINDPQGLQSYLSSNTINLYSNANLNLRVNASLFEGGLKGAIGLDEGDIQELVEVLEQALIVDDNPILEALAQTGLHIYIGKSGSYIEYGPDES
jgi:hypothetical protein